MAPTLIPLLRDLQENNAQSVGSGGYLESRARLFQSHPGSRMYSQISMA